MREKSNLSIAAAGLFSFCFLFFWAIRRRPNNCRQLLRAQSSSRLKARFFNLFSFTPFFLLGIVFLIGVSMGLFQTDSHYVVTSI